MEPFIAQIMMFGGNFAPRGWAFCNGQLLAISQYAALFSLIGTTYGGDGRTTFGLPDLRGRAPIHVGQGPGLSSREWGQRLGGETNTMTVPQMPNHSHTANTTGNISIAVSAETGEENTPNGQYLAAGNNFYNDSPTTGANLSGGSATNLATTIGNTGGQQPMNNMQPSLAIYYVIALQGIFPSRS